MGCARTFKEVVDKIPCFTCAKFEMSEMWVKPTSWHPYCWVKNKTIKSFKSECPDYVPVEVQK